MKTLTAKQVKRLEPGADVYLVNDKTGKRASLRVIRFGRKKVLRSFLGLHEIEDLEGCHYEIEEEKNEAAV